MTEKMLIIHDAQYFNYATVHFTDDHPTDDLENYFDWDLEPAPPKDWKEQMYELELRNARLSRFIMDWLGRELDIQNEDGVISITDLLPFRKLEDK